MINIASAKALLQRFAQNNDGNLAPTFGLSMIFVVATMGAATDFADLTKASARSQNLADRTALSAAIFIKDNDRLPEDEEEGYVHNRVYTAADIGFSFSENVRGGADGVRVRVNYNERTKEALVRVQGEIIPRFSQLLGKETLPFNTQTVVSYLEADDSAPASVSLVLDNSGSMAWDESLALSNGLSPSGARSRIRGLKETVIRFNRELRNRLPQRRGEFRSIRMGMIPYNQNIINNNRISMRFGYLRNGRINRMNANGGTNSTRPMEAALNEMRREDNIHRNEARRHNRGFVEPVKFVILMSDGRNSPGKHIPNPDPTVANAYRFNTMIDDYQEVTWPLNFSLLPGWTRGTLTQINNDDETLKHCEALKALGVEIFTIGFGLDVGRYNENRSGMPRATQEVTLSQQSTAFSFLSRCASEPDNFIRADDLSQLQKAFDTIQTAVVEEIIRIKA